MCGISQPFILTPSCDGPRRRPSASSKDRAEILHPEERVKEELTESRWDLNPAFVAWIKGLEPRMMTKRKELIKQFRDAVYEHQQRGLRRH
jgi:hypothetical protein